MEALKEERFFTSEWYIKEPDIPESNADKGITTVFTDLDITTGVFTMEK